MFGKYRRRSELYITQIRPQAAKVQEAVERLVALQIHVAAEEFGAARQMSEAIHVWMLAATALALLAGAAMAVVITRSISGPLRQAVALARTVAGGDLSAQIEVRGTDETAELLGALREMNGQLVRVITEVRSTNRGPLCRAIAGFSQDLPAHRGAASSRRHRGVNERSPTCSTTRHAAGHAPALEQHGCQRGGSVFRTSLTRCRDQRHSQKITDISRSSSHPFQTTCWR